MYYTNMFYCCDRCFWLLRHLDLELLQCARIIICSELHGNLVFLQFYSCMYFMLWFSLGIFLFYHKNSKPIRSRNCNLDNVMGIPVNTLFFVTNSLWCPSKTLSYQERVWINLMSLLTRKNLPKILPQIREQISGPEISQYEKSILDCEIKGSGPIMSNFWGSFFHFFGVKKIF